MSQEIAFKIDNKFLVGPETELEIDGITPEFLSELYKPGHTFDFAYGQWLEYFDLEKICAVAATLESAGDLRNPGVRDRYQAELMWLKELRRVGTRLIDTYKLVGDKHKAPKSLKKVVSAVGQYKDEMLFIEKRNRDYSELLEVAVRYSGQKIDFVPADISSFLSTYYRYISEIKTILEGDALTLESHHELRKKIRTLRHFFYLVGITEERAEARMIADYLEPVSAEMGKVQDQIFVMKRTGCVNPEEDKTRIRQKHQRIITDFINKHTV